MNKYAHLAPRRTSTNVRRCVTKVRFRSEEVAGRAARDLSVKHETPLRPYHCPMCLGFHLTSKPNEQ